MDSPTKFIEFPKMPRLRREVIISEKIDGTNAQVLIVPSGECPYDPSCPPVHCEDPLKPGALNIYAGSRTRWLQPRGSTDNYGFAEWVKANAEELKKLGPGRHYGEWWGKGIQRGYGLTERRFSLFNCQRWMPTVDGVLGTDGERVSGVYVVPVLAYAKGDVDGAVTAYLSILREGGSLAAPGFRNPEGLIVWHTAANHGFKVTLENDNLPKSQS